MDFIIFTCVSGILFQRSIGAYQLAHFLRQNNYNVQVIDFTDYFTKDELLEACYKFISNETLAIGISTTFYSTDKENFGYSKDLDNKFQLQSLSNNLNHVLKKIREQYPNIKIVIGGAKSASTKLGITDKVINGYAEQEVLDYLNELNGKIKIKNLYRQQQFFSIEHLDHRFLKNDCILDNETLPIEISRGCIFKCKFCAFPLNGKNKLDYLRDPERIKEEMIYNFENYKVRNYFFSDDTFNDSTIKVEKIHKAIMDLPFKINFTTYLRLDLLYHNQSQIEMLKDMGLATAFFGIETLNQKTASCIGKGMNVERTKSFLTDLYENKWGRQIPITCSFIIGLPYESVENIEETYNWIKGTGLSSMFFPLAITDKAFFKSEFDTNYQSYGYEFNPKTGFWSNEFMNSDKAYELSSRYNNELMKYNDTPSGWFLMSLLNNGYNLEEAKRLKVSELSLKRMLRSRLNKISQYKKLLKDLNEKTHLI